MVVEQISALVCPVRTSSRSLRTQPDQGFSDQGLRALVLGLGCQKLQIEGGLSWHILEPG